MKKFLEKLLIFLFLVDAPHSYASSRPEDFCKLYLESIQKNGLKALPDFIHQDDLNHFNAIYLDMFNPFGISLNAKKLISYFYDKETTYEKIKTYPPTDSLKRTLYIARPQVFNNTNIQFLSFEILGTVMDGDTAIVKVRRHFKTGIEQTNYQDLYDYRFRQEKNGWKVLFEPKFLDEIKRNFAKQALCENC